MGMEYSGGLLREQWPYICGFLALPIIGVFVAVATLMTPGYTHMTDTISQLGAQGRPKPWIANTGIFFYGLLVLAFAYGLGSYLGDSRWGKGVSILVGLNGAAAIFAAVFQASWGEAEVEASIFANSVHQFAARTGFVALNGAMFLLPATLWRRTESRRGLGIMLAAAISATVIGLLFVFKTFPDYSGVVQRCYFAVCGLWLQVMALRLIGSNNKEGGPYTQAQVYDP